jgi:6-pyruvoyltetrahydropterin/6-carboxytetrahydropterin synthase
VKVFKRFTIDAAHRLPDMPGLHGHTYRVEVWFEGPVVGGYVIREADLNVRVERVRTKLDHKYLNDIIPVPTSENIAKFIWDALADTGTISKVIVFRPSCGMGVEYAGESER